MAANCLNISECKTKKKEVVKIKAVPAGPKKS